MGMTSVKTKKSPHSGHQNQTPLRNTMSDRLYRILKMWIQNSTHVAVAASHGTRDVNIDVD
jgi:hypothetical protein